MAIKKIKRNIGDVLIIDLGDGEFSFARVLNEPIIGFYDIKYGEIPSIENIIKSKIIFKICVMNSAVTSGRWKVIGNEKLDSDLQQVVPFFREDALTKALFIYKNDKEYPASKSDCESLERAAVWNPEHVEDRLRDYFNGVPNKWVELLKLK